MRFAAFVSSARLLAAITGAVGGICSASQSRAAVPQDREAAFLSAGSCDNVVRFDDRNLYLGYGPYMYGVIRGERPQIPGRLDVIPLANPEARVGLQTRDGVVDAATVGSTLYVLTYSEVEEWNLAGERPTFVSAYPTAPVRLDREGRPFPLRYREHATGMALHRDRALFISHGRLGVVRFDLATKRPSAPIPLIPRQAPLESQAVGIAAIGESKAAIVLDNFSLRPEGNRQAFRGVSILDMDASVAYRELGTLDPGAVWIAADGRGAVLTGMIETITRFSADDLLRGSSTLTGRSNRNFASDRYPIGRAFVDEKNIYVCSNQAQPSGRYRKTPFIIHRAQFMLD